jgi:hypothetical protein
MVRPLLLRIVHLQQNRKDEGMGGRGLWGQAEGSKDRVRGGGLRGEEKIPKGGAEKIPRRKERHLREKGGVKLSNESAMTSYRN